MKNVECQENHQNSLLKRRTTVSVSEDWKQGFDVLDDSSKMKTRPLGASRHASMKAVPNAMDMVATATAHVIPFESTTTKS